METPAIQVAAQPLARSQSQTEDDVSDVSDQTISHYRLIRNLSQGGMGSVCLGERNDGRFDRRVAVKLLSRSIVGPASVARFKREGNILGRLSHPHIAELIDAGVTPKAEPYLVSNISRGSISMRIVTTTPLDVDARIKLLLDVASAVAHAHGNLIVHRDLKPSNGLVRKDGQVKLLDFGIAKLLDSGDPAAATLTQEGERALTLRFATPEQITGGDITTATDVYALGLLMYILLTGHHPTGEAAHSSAEIVKSTIEIEPPKMSDATASERPEVAARRATTPEKLFRRLRGDLDAQTIAAFEQASRVLTDLGYDRTRTAIAMYSDCGLALMLAGRPLEAEKIYRRGLDAWKDGESGTIDPMLINNYADTLLNLGRFDQASEYAERAYQVAQQQKDQDVIKYILIEQARIFRSQCDVPRRHGNA